MILVFLSSTISLCVSAVNGIVYRRDAETRSARKGLARFIKPLWIHRRIYLDLSKLSEQRIILINC